MTKEHLCQIDAPRFCAGFIVVGRKVTKAAPILDNRHFSIVGWSVERVKAHCDRRGWKVYSIPAR